MPNAPIPPVSLKEEDLLLEAKIRAGSSDWGNYNFQEALRVLLKSVDQEARLSRLGRFATWRNITRALTNRLYMEREKKNAPSPHQERCRRHVFISGLPRTGTTMLHNLMILDPETHFMRLCDGMYPVPPPHPETWNKDRKLAVVEEYTANLFALRPGLKSVHDMHPTGPEECLWLFEHQFLDPIFSIRMHTPSYFDWLFGYNHDASYADYHDMLNLLGRHFPSSRWTVKAPRHMYFLDSLLNEFPDACIIWAHRDPVKAITSMASLSYLYRQSFSDSADAKETGRFQYESMSKGIRRALALRNAHGDETRFYDMHYKKLVTDPVREIIKIYEYFSLPFTPAIEKSVKVWLQENPQHKHGKHRYFPEDFGLTNKRIRQEFSVYTERFSIPQESA